MGGTTSKYESGLIHQIADRAIRMAVGHGGEWDKIEAHMDIRSAHLDCGLVLHELLAADDFNFAHDVFGIRGHMDRTKYPGKLVDCFLPRYAIKG